MRYTSLSWRPEDKDFGFMWISVQQSYTSGDSCGLQLARTVWVQPVTAMPDLTLSVMLSCTEWSARQWHLRLMWSISLLMISLPLLPRFPEVNAWFKVWEGSSDNHMNGGVLLLERSANISVISCLTLVITTTTVGYLFQSFCLFWAILELEDASN